MRINFAPIAARMIELGWSRQYLCAKAGVSRDSLYKIEHNQPIFSTTMVKKLCMTLGIKPIEVVQNVAFTQAQGAEDLGDGKRPAETDNEAN